MISSAQALARERRAAERSDTRSRFFVAMAVLLPVIVFVGFAPTFYLKSFFDTPELPWVLHVHAAVLTTWYALFLAQTLLIATHRTATHQRLGVFTGVTAVLVILMTLAIILGANASTEARGITRTPPIEFIVLGDLSVLAAFSILVPVGISCRHRPALHKRAMLLASIALVVPALARLARFPVFAEAGPALVPAALFSLLSAIWVHDWFADRRVHATTAWGSALILLGLLASGGLATTEAGKAFVAAISIGTVP